MSNYTMQEPEVLQAHAELVEAFEVDFDHMQDNPDYKGVSSITAWLDKYRGNPIFDADQVYLITIGMLHE